MTIVDTHAHIYHQDETVYPMITEPFRPPEGKGVISHLKEDMQVAGVGKAVLVQTGSAYRWDNRLLADTAFENQRQMVGVCTLDPASEESIKELDRLVSGFNVRGLRMEPTQAQYPRFYHPGAVRMWEAAQRMGIVVCAHIGSSFLLQLADLLDRFPEVPVVLDHAAYPKASEGFDSKTVKTVVDLSSFQNLLVKLTFAVSGSDEEFPFRDMHPIVRRFIEAFGPDRCMWGSGFPCELWLKKATYQTHLALFTNELGLSNMERCTILEDTPMRVWFGS